MYFSKKTPKINEQEKTSFFEGKKKRGPRNRFKKMNRTISEWRGSSGLKDNVHTMNI